MEYHDLVQERLAEWERTVERAHRESEALRLADPRGIVGPMAHLDGLLIRASRGASERQARREQRRELAS